MGHYDRKHIQSLVRADRVHRDVYTDPKIFQMEMDRLWHKAWIYVGHASQVPNKGDYVTTSVGLEPVVMVRGKEDDVHVIYNRCAHKGAKVAVKPCGNTKGFRCPYHGWTYKLDGALRGVPARSGYDGSDFDVNDPQFHMQKVARIANCRGFIFASLSAEGPSFEEFFGDALATINNMVDRAPDGEVEAAGGVYRYTHDNNWKMFVENLNDALHPMVAHASVGDAARRYAKELPEGTPYPSEAEIIFPFGSSYEFFDKIGITALPNGHSYMGGEASIHTDYSDIPGYMEAMEESYGGEKMKKILSQNRHNTVFYPSFTAKDAIQAIRVVRPVAVNKTIVETHHFRLKGAPEEMFRRTLLYSRLINSNASMVGPDDWDCYRRMQEGLGSESMEWVDARRGLNAEEPVGDTRKSFGTSDLWFRNQYSAWVDLMTEDAA